MKNCIKRYFERCDLRDEAPTVTGLMLHLKMSRDMFYDYCKYPEFADIMGEARNRIEYWLEQKLVSMKTNPTGVIFALKNRFGWKDVQINQNQEMMLTEDEILARISSIAPQLIEALGVQARLENKNSGVKIIDVEAEDAKIGD